MSWSVTFNNLTDDSEIPQDIIIEMMTQHIAYPRDMMLALEMAKRSFMKSAVLTGMRTPNPYGGDEVVDISIRGMLEATDFNTEMKRILAHGPETGGNAQPDAQADAG